jgi:hypothetical protein
MGKGLKVYLAALTQGVFIIKVTDMAADTNYRQYMRFLPVCPLNKITNIKDKCCLRSFLYSIDHDLHKRIHMSN